MREPRRPTRVWRVHTVLRLGAWLLAAGCADDPATTTPVPDPVVDDDASFISSLAAAYEAQDANRFDAMLANDPVANAVFEFAVLDTAGSIRDSWSLATEASIHRRMFDPELIPASDPPLPDELWLETVDVTLTQRSDFVERAAMYQSVSNPTGLDPARWRVTAAEYSTHVFFQMRNTEFVVRDREAEFVVVEDLQRDTGHDAKFLLLRWSEPCETTTLQSRDECWSTVKAFYAK